MARKRTSKKRPPDWWEPLAEQAASFIGRAAGHLVGRILNGPRPPSAPARKSKSATARKPRKPPTWWKVLEVPPTATVQDIKASYRKLMSGTHPDKVSHLSVKLQKAAEREAKKLNSALDEALKHPR